jgi:hypothetical protein
MLRLQLDKPGDGVIPALDPAPPAGRRMRMTGVLLIRAVR